jgi:hypothetical protein
MLLVMALLQISEHRKEDYYIPSQMAFDSHKVGEPQTHLFLLGLQRSP